MKSAQVAVGAALKFVHHYFLWLLVGSYVLAAAHPSLGLALREISLGEVSVGAHKTVFSLPVVMLAILLLNAGLAVKIGQLGQLIRKPLVILTGLAGNLVVPIAFIWGVAFLMRHWHDPDEVQLIIVGLTLVAAMPIAGSSTAWSQNSNGDMALSLGLMLLSTFLSPLTTPFTFKLVESLTFEEYTDALFDLSTHGTRFLFWVVIPVIAGMIARRAIGERRIESAMPTLKFVNLINLLVLNYCNASVSLPQMLAEPAWQFLGVTLGIVSALCVLTFTAGWLLAWLFRLDRAQRISLMFGLGMNNNGTGLVLASIVLVEYPEAMLPLIFYNLVQHLVAGCVHYFLNRPAVDPAGGLAAGKA
jgi:BASS family bile acid:Na+ symporter